MYVSELSFEILSGEIIVFRVVVIFVFLVVVIFFVGRI